MGDSWSGPSCVFARSLAALVVLLACGCSASHAPPTKPMTSSPASPVVPTAADAAPSQVTPAPVVTPPAAPAPTDPTELLLALPPSATTSLGGPSSGTLVGGIAVPDQGPGYLHNLKRPGNARYGTIELVAGIARAAAIVDRELPGSVLVVNDLSLPNGGPILQHGSHQSGRDADILYYSLDAHGVPLPSVGVPLDPNGKGWDFKDLSVAGDDQRVQLDAPRTWRFVQALLETLPDVVQRIFMVEHVRTLLLAQAQKAKAPKALVQRFADITCQPSAPHDDHMHVRLFCSPDDITAGCEDSPPLYPWRTALLAALDEKSVIASAYHTAKERAERADRITTPGEARKKAGPMHARVIQFLEERKAWLTQPHPGRTYCR